MKQSEENSFWIDLSLRLPKPAYEKAGQGNENNEEPNDINSNRSQFKIKKESVARINLP